MEAEGRLTWAELSRGEVRFVIEGLAGVRQESEWAGLAVSPLEVIFYGMRECYLKDPDGRQLTLAGPSGPDDVVTITEL